MACSNALVALRHADKLVLSRNLFRPYSPSHFLGRAKRRVSGALLAGHRTFFEVFMAKDQGFAFMTRQHFLGAPEPEAHPEAALGVAGIAWDGCVTNRPGARFGPNAIRQASHMLCDGTHPLFDLSPSDDPDPKTQRQLQPRNTSHHRDGRHHTLTHQFFREFECTGFAQTDQFSRDRDCH